MGKISIKSVQDQLQQLRKQEQELEAMLATVSQLGRQREALVELRDRLKNLDLPDSMEEKEQLKGEIEQGRQAVQAAHQALFQVRKARRASAGPRTAQARPARALNQALKENNNRPMTDAELINSESVQRYMQRNNLEKGQILNAIRELTEDEKLILHAGKYSLPR